MSMPELVPPTGRVHWVGTGLSTGSGLRILADQGARVVLWGRTEQRAEQCAARLSLAGRAEVRAFDPSSLAAALEAGDVVVSMLPAPEHPALLRPCLDAAAHFACSSYVSDDIRSMAPAAAAVGVVVLTEAGLDPGIDHLLAHELVRQAKASIGEHNLASATFTSYCGGIPAVANEFRYRFSWAPRSVLTALGAPARYIEHGAERVVARPWEATRPHTLGQERFEVYPNRDSIPFVERYDIPTAWRLEDFVRGTLRLEGWHDAWAPVFDVLRHGDTDRIGTLADELGRRYPTTDSDRDRVVLSVSLDVRGDGGTRWSGKYLLDTIADATESAMARCVSTTLACGVSDILAGATAPGLHCATAHPDAVRRWLAFLGEHGITSEFRSP
jgi:hypothetical protein